VSAPFVTTLRSRPGVVSLAPAGAPDAITVRVEVPELWDVVRVAATLSESVLAVKVGALAVLAPGRDHRAYVMKLRGIEVLDEQQSLADAGAMNGSIFLLTHRRRRPVR
jgi:hypothetical protein